MLSRPRVPRQCAKALLVEGPLVGAGENMVSGSRCCLPLCHGPRPAMWGSTTLAALSPWSLAPCLGDCPGGCVVDVEVLVSTADGPPAGPPSLRWKTTAGPPLCWPWRWGLAESQGASVLIVPAPAAAAGSESFCALTRLVFSKDQSAGLRCRDPEEWLLASAVPAAWLKGSPKAPPQAPKP